MLICIDEQRLPALERLCERLSVQCRFCRSPRRRWATRAPARLCSPLGQGGGRRRAAFFARQCAHNVRRFEGSWSSRSTMCTTSRRWV